MAARWLEIPRRRYFGDFGIVAAEAAVQDSLRDFAGLIDILGFELEAATSEWATRIEILGVTVTFTTVDGKCEAQQPALLGRVTKLVGEIRLILERKEVSPAQTQKLVGKLNFAQTSVFGEVGTLALIPLYALVMRGGRGVNKRARWALEWRLKILPVVAPRIIRPIGRAVVVRSYTYPGTTGGGIAAVASSSRQQVEFTVLLNGVAGRFLLESSGDINDIFGL